jgi:hypothetical protein
MFLWSFAYGFMFCPYFPPASDVDPAIPGIFFNTGDSWPRETKKKKNKTYVGVKRKHFQRLAVGFWKKTWLKITVAEVRSQHWAFRWSLKINDAGQGGDDKTTVTDGRFRARHHRRREKKRCWHYVTCWRKIKSLCTSSRPTHIVHFTNTEVVPSRSSGPTRTLYEPLTQVERIRPQGVPIDRSSSGKWKKKQNNNNNNENCENSTRISVSAVVLIKRNVLGIIQSKRATLVCTIRMCSYAQLISNRCLLRQNTAARLSRRHTQVRTDYST